MSRRGHTRSPPQNHLRRHELPVVLAQRPRQRPVPRIPGIPRRRPLPRIPKHLLQPRRRRSRHRMQRAHLQHIRRNRLRMLRNRRMRVRRGKADQPIPLPHRPERIRRKLPFKLRRQPTTRPPRVSIRLKKTQMANRCACQPPNLWQRLKPMHRINLPPRRRIPTPPPVKRCLPPLPPHRGPTLRKPELRPCIPVVIHERQILRTSHQPVRQLKRPQKDRMPRRLIVERKRLRRTRIGTHPNLHQPRRRGLQPGKSPAAPSPPSSHPQALPHTPDAADS